MYNAHPYFSLKNLGKKSVYYTWQKMVTPAYLSFPTQKPFLEGDTVRCKNPAQGLARSWRSVHVDSLPLYRHLHSI